MTALKAKINGEWVTISLGADGQPGPPGPPGPPAEGGLTWQIRTADPPLWRGDAANVAYLQPQAFIELDRIGIDGQTASGQEYRSINFHPMSQYGPIWYTSNTLMDVNTSEVHTFVYCDKYGNLSWYIADQYFFYGGTNYDTIILQPIDVVIGEENYLTYKRDWHEQYNASTDLGIDGMYTDPEHWISYHYVLPPGHTSAPLPPTWVGEESFGGSDAWYYLTSSQFEFGCEAVNDWPDTEAQGGFLFWTPEKNNVHCAESGKFTIWNELITSNAASGFGSPYAYEQLEVHFDASMISIRDGVTRGLSGGDRRRGCIPALQSGNDSYGTAVDPVWKQWYGQVSEDNVVFTAGVGGITTIEKMGDGNRHVQASVVGTTVGGPMIAQVNSPDPTHVNFYLNTAHTGTLKVSWSAQFQEPSWSTTQPIMGYCYVGWEQWGTVAGQTDASYEPHWLDRETVLIPWTSPGMTIRLRVWGNFTGTPTVHDSTGAVRGTVTVISGSFKWDIGSDWYPLGTTETFHVRVPSGERSNPWRMKWAYGPVPPPLPVGMVLMADEEEDVVSGRMVEEEEEDRRRMRRMRPNTRREQLHGEEPLVDLRVAEPDGEPGGERQRKLSKADRMGRRRPDDSEGQ